MDIDCKFQNETNFIDNFIHLLHCAPQYFVKNERIINSMLDKTVEFLIIMFDTFHKHTTGLKYYVLQHKQSCDENDYSNIKEICRIIQELKNESYRMKQRSSEVLKNFQEEITGFKSMKPKGMVDYVLKTKLKANIGILLHLLNYKDKNPARADFTDVLKNPKIYIEQQAKLLEDQKKKANQDLASYKKEIKSNTNKQKASINQRSKTSRSTLVENWVIKEKDFKMQKTEVEQRLSQKLHLLKCNLEIDLKEKAQVSQLNIDKCKVHHEKETSKYLIKLEQQYEHQCLKEYNHKIKSCNLQYQEQRSRNKRYTSYGQQISKASELENALVTKKCATDEENEVLAIYHQKCKVAKEIANNLLCDIERRKSAEYRKYKEEIENIDETVTNESNDSTREACEVINKFEKELKKKEEAIIAETKRLHLQNLFQSMKVQLEYVEHRRQQQMQLNKALSISCQYVNYAIKYIESYLYTTEFFWEEILRASSTLLKTTVCRNFTELNHFRNTNKIVAIKKLEIEQKSTTFKISVKQFFVECSAIADECCLIDEKMTTARENILKLSTYTK